MTHPRRTVRVEHGVPGMADELPEVVRVRLLGGFEVSVGSRTIEQAQWRLRKAASLIKLLALAPDRRLHRERVMYLLWPELDTKAAANNLRYALHQARETLESSGRATASRFYLPLRDEQLALCPEGPLWIDVKAFEEAAAAARRSREPTAYRAALDLYAGELLPENLYEEWAEGRRGELRRTYLALLLEQSALYEEREEFGPAIEALRRVVAEEHIHEGAHAGLMRLYTLSGQRQQALRQYEQLREVLLRELGTEPGATTRQLYEEILAGHFPLARPPRKEEGPVGGARHNLPAARTSFIGREHEMLEVKRLLAMTRLLTLTGVGGSGKTRLALEVTKDLVGAYPDGVWLVQLAGLSKPELVAQTVAAALKIPEQPGRSINATLADHLRTKDLLLVLDNCEHLIEPVAHLIDALLDECPKPRVLATSREALDVAGEVTWRVPSLSLPNPRQPPAAEELSAYESVRLFVDRARQRNPAFALSPQNARAVAEICERLGGMPLAIELAAARVGVLSVEQIAAKLNDSLSLLTQGSRRADPRQQTLRATLDWSYDLLDGPERTLFGRLSVFAGGWTLEAIETVGAGEGVAEKDVLDLLSMLVYKSLAVAEVAGQGALRYRMLEPVRQYAWEKLEESGELEETLRRHALCFVALAEEAAPKLTTAEQGAWLERLEVEHDNLRAALGWVLKRGDAEMALRLGVALWRFWFLRSYLSEGRRWLEEALALSSGASALRARLSNGAGVLVWCQGDYRGAKELYEESLMLSRELGDKQGIADALENLGCVARDWGDYATARSVFEEALLVRRELGEGWGIAESLFLSGSAAAFQGDYAAASPLLEEALALYREAGERRGIGEALGVLGLVATSQGEYRAARSLIEEAQIVFRRLGYRRGYAKALGAQGDLELEQGEHVAAHARYEEALVIFRDLDDKWWIAWCLEGIAGVATAQKQPVRAARLFGAAKVLRDVMHTPGMAGHRGISERHLEAAQAQLDEATFAAAWAEGRAGSAEEAIEHALSAEKPARPASPTSEQASAVAQPPSLSRREKEVAMLVGAGLTNRRIAEELSISEHTVIAHVRKVLKKLGFRSRAQIAAWVAEQGPLL